MLRESSQGEISVMRLRLQGRKEPIRGYKKNHYEYALAKQIYISWKQIHISQKQIRISRSANMHHNGFLMTLKSDSTLNSHTENSL